MAGSYDMARTDLAAFAEERYDATDGALIENMGDAWEAMDEMVWLIDRFIGFQRARTILTLPMSRDGYYRRLHRGEEAYGSCYRTSKRWRVVREAWWPENFWEVHHRGVYIGTVVHEMRVDPLRRAEGLRFQWVARLDTPDGWRASPPSDDMRGAIRKLYDWFTIGRPTDCCECWWNNPACPCDADCHWYRVKECGSDGYESICDCGGELVEDVDDAMTYYCARTRRYV